MYDNNENDSEWRYSVEPEGQIRRARLVRDDDLEVWTYYWEGTGVVAFYDEFSRGIRPLERDEDTDRAIAAFKAERDGRHGAEGALDRLAKRINPAFPDAQFLVIHLERDIDLHVWSHDGDPDRKWRNEIEAVWHGEVYRPEIEEFTADGWDYGGDGSCSEWYGRDNAEAALACYFPLTEFPAELTVPDVH